MPTIKQLPAAAAAADDDLIAISQTGSTRRVTRSQFLSGMQPALALMQGSLLGRSTSGVGGAETVIVGDNLKLRDGVLSGTPAFSVTALPTSSAVGNSDSVAVSQGGRDASVPVGALLAGLSTIPGIDVSGQIVRAQGGVARSLADWVADSLPVEAFGAVGDGFTDDTAAIDRAVASGRPVLFGARTYVLNGQWTVTRAAILTGVSGRTVLRRAKQSGGAWVSISGPSFSAHGIEFDCGTIPGESWGILVGEACRETLFDRCVFHGSSGATLGSGLVIQARDGVFGGASRHVVRECEAWGNAAHGIWVQAAAGAVVEGCMAHDNQAYGICLDFNVNAGRISGQRGGVKAGH